MAKTFADNHRVELRTCVPCTAIDFSEVVRYLDIAADSSMLSA